MIEALIGSAGHGNGIVRVLKALRHEAPAPSALRDRLQAQAGLGEAPLAVVFASAYRKHVGKTLLLRALAPLAAGQAARRQGAGPAHPRRPARHAATSTWCAEGEIVSAVKAEHLAAGRLATADALHETPAWHRPQPAMAQRILAPTSERDSVKLSGALASLAEGDGALTVTQDPATGGALVGIQGPLHLRVLRQRLKETFGMEVEEVIPEPRLLRDHRQEPGDRLPPQEADRRRRPVRRRAPDRRPGAARHRLRLLRGGQGRRGPAQLHPRRRDRRPRRHGARPPRLPGGRRLGDPDRRPGPCRRQLRHGLPHRRPPGHQGGAEVRRSVLLQPVFKVTIHAPAMFTGASVPSSPRTPARSSASTPTPPAGWERYEALVPGGSLAGIANDVRSATQGVGWFEQAFDHYEELHGKAADRIVTERARNPPSPSSPRPSARAPGRAE